jgi:hypothetical protein
MAYELRNENIISFTPRNMITIVVMVTVGWFILHLFGVGASTVTAWMTGFTAGEDAAITDEGADASVMVTY